MVFWPILMLALSGLATLIWVLGSALTDPSFLSLQVSLVDQYFLTLMGSDVARIVLVFTSLASVAIGLGIYMLLTKDTANDEETELFISRRLVWIVLLWTILPAIANAIVSYTALQDVFGQFIFDIILCGFYGIGCIVGLGFVSEYYSFTLKAKSTHSRLDLYLVRRGDKPSIIVDATDVIGGYFYMLFDTRVVNAVMRIVPLPYHQTGSPRKSSDEVRRDQHLTW
ncbi:MAG: hypothetical protein P1Q69_19860 [Candidatus Thorarchaeota archaeon]|nr:hypothetical protein [Candidatus Thorarchaeota archaeon]